MRMGAILLLFSLFVAACTREEKVRELPPGKVTATAAYEKYFGAPPAVQEGEAFAVAGFLPLTGKKGNVRPLPLFMITDGRRPDLLIAHLIGLQKSSLPPGVANPFPPGTRLAAYAVKGDTAEVALTFPGDPPGDPLQVLGIAGAIGHSLTQFPEIRRVRVTAGGELLPGLPREGYLPDPEDILGPEEPRPIGVAGTWENGRPQEVSVFFDRPVTVQEIRLTSDGGRALQGEYYRSVFDMAVVVHPADPTQVAEGMPVTVEWQASDPLGRAGAGRETFRLRRLDHP